GDDVHHRTGVASVFRPKLAGDQNVLLDKLRIGDKQTGTADAVVIVVLSVNLLVIVTSAKTVNREPGAAVGVGEPVVARRGDARDKQRQVVKPLVFSNAGEGCELCAGKSIRHLRLCCFNQWGCTRDFHCGRHLADGQSKRAEAAVASGGNQDLILRRSTESLRSDFDLIFANRNQVEAEGTRAIRGGCQDGSGGAVGSSDCCL